ncbi:fungal-specific transcription factor domain-containing protein [Xylariales sp. PMI_506]|nr:fungal-specific transcription factor domain-containing protein [Xylariales sp. PMI_506]
MKCDRKIPSCSQCVGAKVECTGISAAAKGDVPRSIVLNLESEIARLETELAQDGQLDALNATDILLQMPISHNPVEKEIDETGHHPTQQTVDVAKPSAGQPTEPEMGVREFILFSKPIQTMISATLPCGSGATDLLSKVRMGMTPSTARVGQGNAISSAVNPKPSKGSSFLSAQVLRNVPADIVQRLLRKYLSTIHPENPFLDPNVLWQQFDRVSAVLGWQSVEENLVDHPIFVLPDYDFLVVYLVLAISITLGSARGGHEARHMSLSASLFEEGIQHLYSLVVFPSDIAWLQTTLLVLLYGTVLPRSANVWVLSGAAMRACLELGLHREPPSTMGLDAREMDLRRKVFWSAYSMDRSICGALQRPLSTPDAAIDTKFPEDPSNEPFIGSIHYHQLLSEMIHVHFEGEELPGGLDWDSWQNAVEKRLRNWYDAYPEDNGHHDLAEFAVSRGLMILHRPSPRVPLPSDRSLLIAFEAASSSARIHQEHIRSGVFRRPWLSAHYTLEAAMIVLFCLRHGCLAISQKFDASQIFQMTKLFTLNFLSISSQGWPEVSNYAGVYERLLGPLLESVFSHSQDPSDKFGSAQDAELMRMLYPGPAHLEKLRFGFGQQEQLSPFDFSIFNVDDDEFSAMLNQRTPGDSSASNHILPEVDFSSYLTAHA